MADASRSFTDDQITAIVAGLITALRQNRTSFGADWEIRAAVRQATDIMNLLRGLPTEDQAWRQRMEEEHRRAAEWTANLTRFLATGHYRDA